MKRLSGTDMMFLSGETPAWHQHVGGLTILDPSGTDRFNFEEVKRTTLERLDCAPKFRWKLKEVPMRLDRAVWVEDKDFDINRHVRRIAVPPPGGRRELGELVGMLMSYQLDRRRPLWEMWYIDGVVGGQKAMILKYHHCLMDGISGAGLAEQLLDLDPNATGPMFPPADPDQAGPYEPSDFELVARALIPTLQTPRKFIQYGWRTAQRGVTILRRRDQNGMPFGVSGPCFNNGSIGPHRASSFSSVALADVRKLKDTLDVKLNDVVLALVAGALRQHMIRHDELPEGSLTAQVPVSTRVADDVDHSNKIATMSATLATNIEDPLERLQAIHTGTQSAKLLTEAVRARKIQSIGEVAPPLLIGLASRALWASNVTERLPVVANVIVSNVPGPPVPIYMCGAQVTGIYASSVLMAFAGLNVTLMSYIDRVDFGFTTDPDMVDDPWEIADGIPDALVELMEAAGLGKPTPVHDPFDVADQAEAVTV